MKRIIIITFSVLLMLFMSILFVMYLIKGDSSRWQVSLGGFLVSALPLFLLFLKKNPINITILLSYYVFLFCTIYLGSIKSFYIKFKWWDSTFHWYKGVLIGFIAITLFKLLIPGEARKDVSRWMLFLFVLSLSVLSSIIWEIFEFLGDLTFTHTMQRGGNTDTMYDLLFGTIGGLLAAIYSGVKQRV